MYRPVRTREITAEDRLSQLLLSLAPSFGQTCRVFGHVYHMHELHFVRLKFCQISITRHPARLFVKAAGWFNFWGGYSFRERCNLMTVCGGHCDDCWWQCILKKRKSSKCWGKNLHLFRATVITSDNGVNSGSGWSLPSQYCIQTARVSGAVTAHEELQLCVFGVFIFVTRQGQN